MTDYEINRRVAVLEGWVEGRLFWHHEGKEDDVIQIGPPDYCGDAALSQALQEKHGIATWWTGDAWVAWKNHHERAIDKSLRRAIALARIAKGDE